MTTLSLAGLLLTGCSSDVYMPEVCDHYFDGCNRCTRNPDETITCTENKCETMQNPHCDENSYNEKYYQRIEELDRMAEDDPEMKEFLDSLSEPEEEIDVKNEVEEEIEE